MGRGKASPSSSGRRQTKLRQFGSLLQTRQRRQVPSQEVLEKDYLGIFTVVASLNRLSKERVTRALIPPPIWQTPTGQIIDSPVLVRRGQESITKKEFARLRARSWLNDSPINFFLHHCVQDAARGIRRFSSGFFTTMYRRTGGVLARGCQPLG